MASPSWIVPDALWELIEPLLPVHPRRFRYPGCRRLPDCEALQGVLFVLCTGSAWRHLPRELGFGSGVTCRRRLGEWQRAGVWDEPHALLLARLRGRRDRLLAGGRRFQPGAGERRGAQTGPSPVDRGRPGSKHHLLVDAGILPLACLLTGGKRNDLAQLLPLLAAVPPVRGCVGAPRRRPKRLLADRAYDHDRYRREVRRRGITPQIAPRGTPHGSGLGAQRWLVERTIAWLHGFRRVLVR